MLNKQRAKFEVLKNESYDKTPINVLSDRLPAFHSGVGDSNDLLVTKQAEAEFYEKFGAITHVYGVYNKAVKKYNPVGFNYRVEASGTYTEDTQEGYMKLVFRAYPVEKVRFRIYKYASKVVNINARIKATCTYYTWDATNSVHVPHLKSVTGATLTYALLSPVTYHAGGIATLDSVDVIISGTKTLLQMAQEAGALDTDIAASSQTPTYSAFLVEDDYPFSDGDPDLRWKASKPRTLQTGGDGTVKVYANMVGNDYNPNDYLRLSGYAEAQLYTFVKYVDKEMSYLEGSNFPLIQQADLTGTPVNIADSTQTYNTGTTTIVEVFSKDPDITIGTINPSGTPVASGTVTKSFISPELQFDFTDTDAYMHIIYNRVLEGMNQSESKNYNFRVDCTGKSSNTILYGLSTPVTVGSNIISGKSNVFTQLDFYSQLHTVTRNWYDIQPPVKEDPLYGIINGKFEADNNFNGKKDLEVKMPGFLVPQNISNVRFRCAINSITPDNALILARFDHEAFPGIGTQELDNITFSSDAVTFVNEEYRDLLASNKFNFEVFDLKSKDFTFALSQPSGAKTYTRYDLKVLSDNNDVAITNAPTVVNFATNPADVTITVKGTQNATSRWSPRIHNGYYYVNQEEHFLFSQFNASANFKQLSEYSETDSYITIDVNLSKSGGALQSYTLTKNDPIELLTNNPGFRYDTMIRPIPIINTKYYKEYQPVDYYSPVFIFPNIVTAWKPVTFNTNIPAGTTISTYVRSFRYDQGVWSDWVAIATGGTPTVPLSGALQFKATMTASVNNITQDMTEVDCDQYDFTTNMDTKLSNNVDLTMDRIKGANIAKNVVYVSTPRDFGTEVEFTIDGYATNTGVKYYLAGSNDLNAVTNLPQWVDVGDGGSLTGFRYYRYKIVIPASVEVNLLYKTFNTPVSTESIPGIGNFQAAGDYLPANLLYEFQKTIGFTIPSDDAWHRIVTSVQTETQSMITAAGYTVANVTAWSVTANTPNVDITYNPADITTYVDAKAKAVDVDYDETPYVNFTGNTCIIQGLPQNFCPVIVQDDVVGPLQEVLFRDENGNPTLTYTQQFTSHYQKCFALRHLGIDESSLAVKVNDIPSTEFTLSNNIIEFNDYVDDNSVVDISYMIENSFMVTLDIDNETTTITVNSAQPLESTRVMFETNINSNLRTIKHLSMNPVYGTDYKGFIYISYDDFPPKKVKIHANPGYVKADGKDGVTVIVQVLDEYDNPVAGEKLDVTCAKGNIISADYTTDTNGVVSLRYTASTVAGFDTIKAVCLSNNLAETFTIKNI